MKKLMLLAAMLTMALVAAAPAIAQVGQENEQDIDSGDVDQSFTVTGGGANGNQCTNISGNANSGNSQNQVGIVQSDDSEVEDVEIEDSGASIDVSGNSSAECVQEVNQAASAAAAPKTAPPPHAPKAAPAPAPKAAPAPAPATKAETPQAKAQAAPAPKAEIKAETPQAKVQQKQLPKTGGSISSLLTLGFGVALIAGGLLARRLVR
jgi:LPXTG-motif cell wall-anchored protein